MRPTRKEVAIQLERFGWSLVKYARLITGGASEDAVNRWLDISRQRKALFSQTRKEYLK